MVANGRKALAELEKLSQEQIDAICKHCLQEFVKVGEELAKEAVEETGLGSVEYKIMKNCGTPTGVWYAIKGLKTRGIIGHDEKHHLTFVAHPKGIIAGVIPTTNPNMTVLVNGIYALKGANAVSYTHLDVYKRQSLNCPDLLRRNQEVVKMNKKAHCDGMILESIQLVEELLDKEGK